MTNIVSVKNNNPMCEPWDSQGNKKMQFLFLLLLAVKFWPERQNIKPFEITLHLEFLTRP